MVVHEDRLRLLTTWDQVLAKGSARCLARLAEEPETTVALYGLDLREAHGVVLALFAPADEVDASAGGAGGGRRSRRRGSRRSKRTSAASSSRSMRR